MCNDVSRGINCHTTARTAPSPLICLHIISCCITGLKEQEQDAAPRAHVSTAFGCDVQHFRRGGNAGHQVHQQHEQHHQQPQHHSVLDHHQAHHFDQQRRQHASLRIGLRIGFWWIRGKFEH